MKALMYVTFGGSDRQQVVELPTPDPGPNQVRVAVYGAPIHPADLIARNGFFGPMLPNGRPYVSGWDVAGVVDAVGANVDDLEVGVAVIGLSNWLATTVGTHAEYVVLDRAAVVLAPQSVSLAEASVLPANSLTAMQALDLLALEHGHSLAIVGAAGAVGGYALELAQARGIEAFAVASSRDRDFIESRSGIFIDRTQDPYRQLAEIGVDALLDTAMVGGSALAAVREDGSYVGLIPPAAPESERGIVVSTVGLHSNQEQLVQAVTLVERNQVTLRVESTHHLEDGPSAFDAAETSSGGVRHVITPHLA